MRLIASRQKKNKYIPLDFNCFLLSEWDFNYFISGMNVNGNDCITYILCTHTHTLDSILAIRIYAVCDACDCVRTSVRNRLLTVSDRRKIKSNHFLFSEFQGTTIIFPFVGNREFLPIRLNRSAICWRVGVCYACVCLHFVFFRLVKPQKKIECVA